MSNHDPYSDQQLQGIASRTRCFMVPIPHWHEQQRCALVTRQVALVPANCGQVFGIREMEMQMRFAEPEPDQKLVERAIVKVLEIAQLQGITPADFIQMLDSGMPISDFLNAADVRYKRPTIG